MLQEKMKVPYILSAVLVALMVVQSVLGRVFPGQYRDVEWIRATWFGNDSVTLILALSRIDVADVAASFRPKTPVRIVGGYLVFVAVGLTFVWIGMWAAYVLVGQPTPIEPEAFKLVAALDTTIMVPALAFGGVLLWRRNAWGYIVATIAGIQGSLYLLVLTINSVVLILRDLAEAPGELPQWGTLAVTTTAATVLLLVNVRRAGRNGDPQDLGRSVA